MTTKAKTKQLPTPQAAGPSTTICAEMPSRGYVGGRLLLLEVAGGLFTCAVAPGYGPADDDLVATDDERAIAFVAIATAEGGKVHRLPSHESFAERYCEHMELARASAREAREARRQRLRAPRAEWA